MRGRCMADFDLHLDTFLHFIKSLQGACIDVIVFKNVIKKNKRVSTNGILQVENLRLSQVLSPRSSSSRDPSSWTRALSFCE